MSIPNVGEVFALQKYTLDTLTLKLYSNNKTPAEGDTAADYTEISGGGYAAKALASGSWVITGGDPSVASYAAQDFNFTGVTNAPAVIYGYFVVDSNNLLRGSERFPAGVIPFTPSNGALIRITPKIQVS